MTSNRVGVIMFFGILVPGAYLAGILVMSIASGIELMGLQGNDKLVATLSQRTGLVAGVFLFVAYLLGVVVRLFAPEYVDRLSEWYLVHVRRASHAWVSDRFPYRSSIASRLEKEGMGRVTELMLKLNPTYGDEGNTLYFNYCKWFIGANNEALSRQVQEAEALVRFLSGTTLVLLIALPLAAFFAMAFAVRGAGLTCAGYTGLLIADAISLVLILERFKHQRRREVAMVWSCVYLILMEVPEGAALKDIPAMGDHLFFPNLEARTTPKQVVSNGPDSAGVSASPPDCTDSLRPEALNGK